MAVKTGRWVLIEDVDKAPYEILAALLSLMEDRVMPGGGKEAAHPSFRLFGTCTSISGENTNTKTNATTPHQHLPTIKSRNAAFLHSLWKRVEIIPNSTGEWSALKFSILGYPA